MWLKIPEDEPVRLINLHTGAVLSVQSKEERWAVALTAPGSTVPIVLYSAEEYAGAAAWLHQVHDSLARCGQLLAPPEPLVASESHRGNGTAVENTRAAAPQATCGLGDTEDGLATTQDLLRRLRRHAGAPSMTHGRLALCAAAATFVVLWVMMWLFFRYSDVPAPAGTSALAALVLTFIAMISYISTIGEVRKQSPYARARAADAALFAALNDVRCVPVLLPELRAANADYRAPIEEAIARLMPLMTDEQLSTLDITARSALRHVLRGDTTARNTKLVVAAIEALARIGDLPSVSLLERLAGDNGPMYAKPEVIAAATRALRTLRASDGRTQPETMLRASAAPTAPSSELLRAATGTNETDAATELLRRVE